MSQNITIKEGDISQGFGHINKLRTSNGSDYDRWVPEDEVDTESLHVDKNGLYYTRAYIPTKKEKKKGKKGKCYGYDSVTVSIINKTHGKDPDGNPISVGVDDEGNLTETELPVRIEIVKDPDVVAWLEGSGISIKGIQVKAYMADGSEYDTGTEGNVIPIEDLDFEPTTAEYTGETYSVGKYGNYEVPWSRRYEHTAKNGFEHIWVDITAGDDVRIVREGHVYTEEYLGLWTSPYIFSRNGYASHIMHLTDQDGRVDEFTGKWSKQTHRLDNGDIIYSYSANNNTNVDAGCTPPPYDGRELASSWRTVAAKALYSDQQVFHGNTVTISWTPPEGVEELTDTYEITVIPSPVPPNDN